MHRLLHLVSYCLLLPLATYAETSTGTTNTSLSTAEMVALLKTIDQNQANSGDYRIKAYMEQKDGKSGITAYELSIYRRDDDDQLMMLFEKPTTEAGKGYLRIDKNLFIYDPTVGRWERRTEREGIGGTGSRGADFDRSRWASQFDPEYVADTKLGKFSVHHLRLRAKEGVDVPYPTVELWIDQQTGHVLKSQDRALSNRLVRTSYYPEWASFESPSKGTRVFFPKRIHIFDEIEKQNQTQVVFKEVDGQALPKNIFTKAWLESQSR